MFGLHDSQMMNKRGKVVSNLTSVDYGFVVQLILKLVWSIYADLGDSCLATGFSLSISHATSPSTRGERF